jgi:predicted metal-dependent phosphoesterase TrpH
MRDFCDLHTHSNASDGRLTPTQVVDLAKELGLGAVALSDHNTVDGIEEFLNAAKNTEVEAVAGVEVTATFQGDEVHIVGLFIKDIKSLKSFFENIENKKNENNLQLWSRLNSTGYKFDYSEVENEGGSYINRVHFARVLLKHNYVNSIDEAFEGLLKEGNGFYDRGKQIKAEEAITALVSAGALPVIAHPLESLDKNKLEAFIKEMKPYGLKGLETNYSLYDEDKTNIANELCEKYGLLKSGGSDFHGENKPMIKMGTGKGDLRVPYEFYIKLKENTELNGK